MHVDKLGLEGEKKAAKLLKKKGYKIIERNFTCKIGEADIVCLKGCELVLVEVKSRSSDAFGAPSLAVDARKQKKYSDIAKYYVTINKLFNLCVRFDVVEYCGGELNHIENAFYGK